MFLAIINDAYAEVKADLAFAENEIEMGDFFKQVRARALPYFKVSNWEEFCNTCATVSCEKIRTEKKKLNGYCLFTYID